MTAAQNDPPPRRPLLADWVDQPVEIATAVTLSIAALLTSWSGYQAALWDGDQAAWYSRAGALRTAAARASTQAGQVEGVDLLLFSEWLDAYAAGDTDLQAFYRARFRPEFALATDAWLARHPLQDPHAPRTPFAMPQYRPALREQARGLEHQADKAFETGQNANEISDAFVQGTVILASAMFFGGICQAFRTPKVRVALMCVAVLTCLWGSFKVLGLPVN